MLKVENLKRYYEKNKVITKALDGVSFEVKNGEFISIIGASGSGENSIIVTDTIIKLNQGLKSSTKFLNKMILI